MSGLAHLPLLLSLSPSVHENVTFFTLSGLVGDVFAAAKLDELDPEPFVEDEVKQIGSPAKKAKRGSGSSKTGSEAAMETFKEVMTAHIPAKERNLPTDAEAFYAAVMLSDEQKERIQQQLPASPFGPSLTFLAAFDKETLELCGLSALQVRAWLLLGSKVL